VDTRAKKLWHKTKDPACEMEVKWVTKTITKMTQRKAPEWQKKIENCGVTPQTI
jgi:hypothetical protein